MDTTDIVLVEDDPLIGEIARDILAGAGYKVLLVQESREAVAEIKKAMPKLVITDIMMPGITGLDICKAVSSDPALKPVKVVVMSAKSFEVEKRRAQMMGAVAFLTKPFNEKSLLAAVAELISPSAPPAH